MTEPMGEKPNEEIAVDIALMAMSKDSSKGAIELITEALNAKDSIIEACDKSVAKLESIIQAKENEIEDLKAVNKIYFEAKEDRIKEFEKEISEIRNYCMCTFGESHPEMKKCPHELEADSLRILVVGLGNKHSEILKLQEREMGGRPCNHRPIKCLCFSGSMARRSAEALASIPEELRRDIDHA